jgi:MFS family permease
MTLDDVSRRRTDLGRLFAAAFAADLATYLIYTAIPYKALRLGAGPLALGLVAAGATGAYALLVAISGRFSDRAPREALARAACIGIIIACIGLTLARGVPRILALVPLVGGSLAFFWPCVQAAIADRSQSHELERNLGRFNLAWSVGKGSGFLCGGLLLSAFGPESVLTAASILLFVIFWVLPGAPGTAQTLHAPAARAAKAGETTQRPEEHPRVEAEPALAPLDPALEVQTARFRRLAWIANGSAYGVAATLIYHYPRLVDAHGWSPRIFGLILGGMYWTETAAFFVLMRHASAWRFRRAPLFVPQLLLAAGVIALPWATGVRLAVTAIVFGFGLATCYSASIYYSLHGAAERGRNAGIHELLIGIGSMTVPLAGGLLAHYMALEWAPYATAGGVVLLSLIAQEVSLRAGPNKKRPRSRAAVPLLRE